MVRSTHIWGRTKHIFVVFHLNSKVIYRSQQKAILFDWNIPQLTVNINPCAFKKEKKQQLFKSDRRKILSLMPTVHGKTDEGGVGAVFILVVSPSLCRCDDFPWESPGKAEGEWGHSCEMAGWGQVWWFQQWTWIPGVDKGLAQYWAKPRLLSASIHLLAQRK